MPAPVKGLPKIKSIYIDGYAAFAIDRDGKLWYWGAPYWSYYQTGKQAIVAKPRAYAKLDHIQAITGETVLLRTDGTVWSFGDSYGGMLGRIRDSKNSYDELAQIPELHGIQEVSCGYLQCVARDRDDRVWVWGNNSYRQIGDGLQPHRFDHPVMLEGQRAAGVVSGYRSTFLLQGNGTVRGAGVNGAGQIGVGKLGEWGGEEGFGVQPFRYEPEYTFDSFAVTRYTPVLEAPYLLVNGKRVDSWSMQVNGSVYASGREILEAMGYRMTWNGTTKTAEAVRGNTTISLRTEDKTLKINGRAVALGQTFYDVRGNLLLPVRALGEALGWQTAWDAGTYTLRLSDAAIE